jgi:hypothetical protein
VSERKSDLQELFLEDWWAERKDGITPRATHKMLQEHLLKDEGFQIGVLQRLAGLETNEQRDAEQRMLNGKGHFHPEIPPPPRVPSFGPWWSKDPWKSVIKYALVGLAALALGWLARHLGVGAPHTP